MAMFIEDDIKPRSNLPVNVGLRWELGRCNTPASLGDCNDHLPDQPLTFRKMLMSIRGKAQRLPEPVLPDPSFSESRSQSLSISTATVSATTSVRSFGKSTSGAP